MIQRVDFNAFGKGLACKPEHPHRGIVEPWWLRASRQSNIDGVGNLGCQFMKCQGRNEADNPAGHLPGDCHEIRGTKWWEFRESIQPAAELLQYTCVAHSIERPGMKTEPQGLAG